MESLKLIELIKKIKSQKEESYLCDFSGVRSYCLDIISSSWAQLLELLSVHNKIRFINYFSNNLNNEDLTFLNFPIEKKEKYSRQEITLKVKNVLLANEVTTNVKPLEQENYLLKASNSNSMYLACCFLYFNKKGIKEIINAPLVFFKVKIIKKDNEYLLELISPSPIFNNGLIDEFNEMYSIDLTYQDYDFRIDKYVKETNTLLSKTNFALDSNMVLVNLDIEKELRKHVLYSFIKSTNYSSNEVFKTIEKKNENKNLNFNLRNLEPEYIKKALNQLENTSILNLEKDKIYLENFLLHIINEYILKKQNILFVTKSNNEIKKAKEYFNRKYLDYYFPPFDLTSTDSLVTVCLEKFKQDPYIVPLNDLELKKSEINDLIKEYQQKDFSLQNIHSIFDENNSELFLNYYKYYDKSTEIFKFNEVFDYTFNYYLLDLDFIDFIKESNYYQDHKRIDNKFYLINPIVKKEDYSIFKSFINKLKENFNLLEKIIDKSQIKLTKFSTFNTLYEYLNYIKYFDIYKKYFPFDNKYFSFNFSKDILDLIHKLIENYRIQASIRLSIDIACKKEIWTFDFKNILDSLKNKKLERELKKQLKSIIKITPFKKTYKTLIILIDKYYLNEGEIKVNKEALLKVFNNEEVTIDGLNNLLNINSFLEDFKEVRRCNPELNYNNEFSSLYFSSKEFRDVFNECLSKSNLLADDILKEISKFEIIFDKSLFDFKNGTFEKTNNFLSELLNENQDNFALAISFNYLLKKSSPFLKKSVDILSEENRNFKNFDNNYLASLYQEIILNIFKKESVLDNLYSLNKLDHELVSSYFTKAFNYDYSVIESFNSYRKEKLEFPSFNQILERLKYENYSSLFYSQERSFSLAFNLIYHLYPLELKPINDLYVFRKYKFDLLVIDLDYDFDEFDLLYLLTFAEKVIFISSKQNNFEIVPTFKFSLEYDMETFKQFDYLDSFIKLKILNAFKRNNIKVELNKKIDNSLTVPFYFEYQNKSYILKVENDTKLSSQELNDLNYLLLIKYRLKTSYLYLLPFLVYEDLSIKMLTYDLSFFDQKKLLEEQKIDNLSYEQQKRVKYFMTLDEIDAMIPLYNLKDNYELEKTPLRKSNQNLRNLSSISFYEIANGILLYLEPFTFLSEVTLIKRISRILSLEENNIDFISLFYQAKNYLISKNLINENQGKLSLIRKN